MVNSRPGRPDWPEPLAPEARYGLADEIVGTIEPHSEADPAALLFQFLLAFGNVIGRSAYFEVEAVRHYTNLFAILVGATAKGRKGTSWGHVERLFFQAEPKWTARVQAGLSSGEGLIWAVRDASGDDPGEPDKRLQVVEPEFSGTLRVCRREGNILSTVIRQAWDTGGLRTLTKNSPGKATEAHISIIGHITREEVRRHLDSTDAASGFANRFLWVCVRRSKLLPDGGRVPKADMARLVSRLREVVEFATKVGEVKRDGGAQKVWREVYPELSQDWPGLFGAVTSRAEAQVVRLSMIYALLDCSAVIRPEHMHAALAVWECAEASVRFIFGDALGDPVADELLRVLRQSANGLTRTEISAHFGRHKQSSEIGRVLGILQERGLATPTSEESEGRPVERWKAPRACEISEKSEEMDGEGDLNSLNSHPAPEGTGA